MRVNLKLVFVLAGILAVFSFVTDSRALIIDELRSQIEAKNREIQKLEEEAKTYKENILAKEKEAKNLKDQISKVDITIRKLSSDIRLTTSRTEKTRLEIRGLGEEISEKEQHIKKSRQDLAGLIESISERDAEGMLTVFVKYESLSGFLDTIYYLLNIEKGIQDRLKFLRDLKQELESDKARAEVKKAELAALLVRLNDRKEIQSTQKKERSILLTEAQNQGKRYRQLLELTEAQVESIQKETEELEEKLRELVDPGSLPSKREGFLAWPAKGSISQGYGRTSFARWSDFYRFHNGIDIKASIGTSIVAADDGIVVTTGDTDFYCRRGAYGKHVVVRHSNNLTTLYAHLSLIRVSPGDEVKRGELIGYMGSTGLSTGSHLHFTVYDSRTVDIRKSRSCGPLPYGGSINPLDYL